MTGAYFFAEIVRVRWSCSDCGYPEAQELGTFYDAEDRGYTCAMTDCVNYKKPLKAYGERPRRIKESEHPPTSNGPFGI